MLMKAMTDFRSKGSINFVEIVKGQKQVYSQLHCTKEDVAGIIRNLDATPPSDKELATYMDVMTANSSVDTISLNEFCSTISPFIAYEVADDNQSNSVDKKELKVNFCRFILN